MTGVKQQPAHEATIWVKQQQQQQQPAHEATTGVKQQPAHEATTGVKQQQQQQQPAHEAQGGGADTISPNPTTTPARNHLLGGTGCGGGGRIRGGGGDGGAAANTATAASLQVVTSGVSPGERQRLACLYKSPPPGWEVRVSSTHSTATHKVRYFYNPATDSSSWDLEGHSLHEAQSRA